MNPGPGHANRNAQPDSPGTLPRWRRVIGIVGVAVALPFFLWLPLGWVGVVPSMIEFFGIPGLRIPASLTVGGLLVAAIAFHEP